MTDINQASEDELEQKLLFLFRRMSVCAATHQGENSGWIDGRCVTPSTAAKEALAIIRTEKLKLLDRLEEQATIVTSLSGEKAGTIDLTAIENERNKDV